ncbi:hypothetical protein H4R18_003181 [Coemansia javaensis]|uniref:Protein kinase domain-containing protein n=1 Tax=Coemansia javaensis TaxID=2761396 RepID=A0A9W8H9N0_9FUNG|nr:hypothetical protein H4R18_003181 [Coemansia javaensis]
MAHDGRGAHFMPAPLKGRYTVGGAAPVGGAGLLPQLDISRCVPPTAAAPHPPPQMVHPPPQMAHPPPALDLDLDLRDGLAVRVDRTRVIGTGQYSTVCMGALLRPGAPAADAVPCAVKIPHPGSLDARELGLVEAAALWQAGSAPQTVGCYGLVNLRDAEPGQDTTEQQQQQQGCCPLSQWPAVAARALAGQGEWALVLEYCAGGSCWDWMARDRLAMGAELFCAWARQLATALVALKAAGVAHMDIKAHNMLLGHDGCIRLADFTAARFSGQALAAVQLASPGFEPQQYPPYMDFGGTVPYSAPEALANPAKPRSNDELHRMDVYSLGVTLYTLFVGGHEPYATVKSAVEQMLLASRGAFWSWEERHYLAALQSAAETAPSTPVDARPAAGASAAAAAAASATATATATAAGHVAGPPSPPAGPPLQLARSVSSGPRPLARRRTLKSRKAEPREFRRFLSGEPLPPAVEDLLRAMVSPDPLQRPDAADILAALDRIEADIFEG